MSFQRFLILVGALWCLYVAGVSVLGGVVAYFCVSPDVPQCGEAGFRAAQWWGRVAWWSAPLFGGAAVFALRTVSSDLVRLFVRALFWFRRQPGAPHAP